MNADLIRREADSWWELLALEAGMRVLVLAEEPDPYQGALASRGCRIADSPREVDRVIQTGLWPAAENLADWPAGLRRSIRPGGRLLLSLPQRDRVQRDWPPAPYDWVPVKISEDGDEILVERWTCDLLSNRAEVRQIRIRNGQTDESTRFVWIPTFPEAERLLRQAGFTEVRAYGPGGQPLTMESETMLVVAQ